nr:MAG TPA: hypothetical protein [Caudoviricetes sp.]
MPPLGNHIITQRSSQQQTGHYTSIFKTPQKRICIRHSKLRHKCLDFKIHNIYPCYPSS